MVPNQSRQPGSAPRHVGDRRTRCQNCHSFVSVRFARVFGNNDNQVYACPDCTTAQVLRDGVASEESTESVTTGRAVRWESTDS